MPSAPAGRRRASLEGLRLSFAKLADTRPTSQRSIAAGFESKDRRPRWARGALGRESRDIGTSIQNDRDMSASRAISPLPYRARPFRHYSFTPSRAHTVKMPAESRFTFLLPHFVISAADAEH